MWPVLQKLLNSARDRFHPLHRLRKNLFFVDRVAPLIDIPIWAELQGVKWKVRVRLLRHLSWIFNNSNLEPGIYSLFQSIGKVFQPTTFWDIGANIGFYSWLVLSIDNSTQALLFEPDPDNAQLIIETLSRDKLQRAKLLQLAVSDVSGEAQFAIDKDSGATGTLSTGGSFSEYLFGRKAQQITVKTISLDDIYKAQDLPLPDLIKVDVEMCEHLVFRGAQALLKDVQPLIIFECSSSNRDECLSLLNNLNYQLLSAEVPGSDSTYASNILAVPKRYQNRSQELIDVWRTDFESLALANSMR